MTNLLLCLKSLRLTSKNMSMGANDHPCCLRHLWFEGWNSNTSSFFKLPILWPWSPAISYSCFRHQKWWPVWHSEEFGYRAFLAAVSMCSVGSETFLILFCFSKLWSCSLRCSIVGYVKWFSRGSWWLSLPKCCRGLFDYPRQSYHECIVLVPRVHLSSVPRRGLAVYPLQCLQCISLLTSNQRLWVVIANAFEFAVVIIL